MRKTVLGHVHTGSLLICLGKWKTRDASEFQTFCEFCSRCFTSRIAWTPPPQGERLCRTHSRCIPPPPLPPALSQWRFACVHVRLCTCVFAQECGFVLYPPFVAFLWGIFPDSFFLLLWKSLFKLFFVLEWEAAIFCCEILFVSSVWQNYNEWICLCNIIAVFLQRKLWHLDQESLILFFFVVSCKNISTSLKHMPEEFQGNNLTSWFKLQGSHHFSMIFARSISREPLWRNPTEIRLLEPSRSLNMF